MNLQLFKEIVHVIKRHDNLNQEFSKFLEQKICTSSFCTVDYGNELTEMLIKTLCDEFNLMDEYNNKEYPDLITWWLYEDVDKILYTKEPNQKIDVNDIEDFYNYLVSLKS